MEAVLSILITTPTSYTSFDAGLRSWWAISVFLNPG